MSTDDVVIVAAARTPQGRLQGALSHLSAPQLGSIAIRAALDLSQIPSEEIDALIAGHVLTAGVGQNPARQASIGAGLGWNVHASSVNKVCLSGLTAVIDAQRMILSGDATTIVALGMESMSRAPHLLPGSRSGWKYGSIEVLDHAAYDGLTDAYDAESMGASTERRNPLHGITREQQDAVAAESHRRAALAVEAGIFDEEIVSIEVPQRGKDPLVVSRDEGIRADTTPETLARLRPAFTADGTITAGNASQISDGAAAVIVTRRSHAEERGWRVMASLGAAGQVAGPDNSLQLQPAAAIARACEREGITPRDLDLVEINEAFAAVVVASARELDISDSVINVHGGGIALGHPIGCSGTRLVVHLAHELSRRGEGTAAAGLCGGGGQGEALILRGA